MCLYIGRGIRNVYDKSDRMQNSSLKDTDTYSPRLVLSTRLI